MINIAYYLCSIEWGCVLKTTQNIYNIISIYLYIYFMSKSMKTKSLGQEIYNYNKN